MLKKNSINELKRLVFESTDLGEPFNYFFDLMDNNIIFNLKGHQAVERLNRHAELSAVIAAVKNGVNQQLGKPTQVTTPAFFEIPERKFFHGICFALGLQAPVTILYFSDIQIGLFAMTEIGKTDIFRFVLAKKAEMERKH